MRINSKTSRARRLADAARAGGDKPGYGELLRSTVQNEVLVADLPRSEPCTGDPFFASRPAMHNSRGVLLL